MIAPDITGALAAILEGTGEMVPTAMTAADLTDYARARHELAIAEQDKAARLAALVVADPTLVTLDERIGDLAAIIHGTEAALTDLWTEDLRRQAGTIHLKAPGIAIVWPKPATVWEQGVKPEQIAARDAALAAELRIRQVTRKAPPPRITLVAENGHGGAS